MISDPLKALATEVKFPFRTFIFPEFKDRWGLDFMGVDNYGHTDTGAKVDIVVVNNSNKMFSCNGVRAALFPNYLAVAPESNYGWTKNAVAEASGSFQHPVLLTTESPFTEGPRRAVPNPVNKCLCLPFSNREELGEALRIFSGISEFQEDEFSSPEFESALLDLGIPYVFEIPDFDGFGLTKVMFL